MEPAWSTKISGCLSAGKELCPSPRLGGGTPVLLFCHSSCSDPHRRPHLCHPSLRWTGVQGRGARRFLGTRLTCSTVGVCVPGFLRETPRSPRGDHPHEQRGLCWEERNTGYILNSTTASFFGFHQTASREYSSIKLM